MSNLPAEVAKLTIHPLTSGRNVLVISHPTEMFSVRCRSSLILNSVLLLLSNTSRQHMNSHLVKCNSCSTTESKVATGNEDIISIYLKFSSLVKITKYQKGKERPIKGSKIQLIDEVSAAAADSWCMLTV